MIVLDGLVLPADLLWSDEFTAGAVAQSTQRALDGSLVVFYGPRQAGQAITLASAPEAGWLTRAQVEAVAQRAASPGGRFTLQLRGALWTVLFAHHTPPAFEATPLIPVARPQAGDFYLATLKLITV